MANLAKRVEQAILGALPYSDKAAASAIDIVLEEAAKWHDKHRRGLERTLNKHHANDESAAVLTRTSGAIAAHHHAADAIRAMKEKNNG